MEVNIGSNPSFIWRSILWNKDIITNGLIWKVRNGESIHARKDAWIPNLARRKISSCISYDNNVYVKDLILNVNYWDISKLNELLLSCEVDAIKRIPIVHNNSPDARY